MGERTPRAEEPITFHPVAVETLMANLPKKAQGQAVRKCRQVIAAAPSDAGYELHGPLHGFRGIHTSRYRIIWRVLRPQPEDEVAEICYFGKRAEGDEVDAYNQFAKLFGLPNY
jgi:hypothetical protein